MIKRLNTQQIKFIKDLYYDYEIEELIKYIDSLCEYNFNECITLKNDNHAN